ncbi:hypothetical protein BJP36_14825 [Moorena producens JHB]|uniref:Uncharacterized protein n=1 Tax=Moorena producens (strain JHB) TaxID=1454205 RepID=A0A1D9G021_MOOP1|nr:hypothetical protein [Moorena producens]AOY80988.2 hypothetical protein BJP36_14825 [Moorena producens JHB]
MSDFTGISSLPRHRSSTSRRCWLYGALELSHANGSLENCTSTERCNAGFRLLIDNKIHDEFVVGKLDE